ncbi:MAG: hypothetical protein ABMB14_23390 [Myxococcota bacterium]
MSRATRDSAAARSLLARVESRSTGKLTVGAGAVEVAVHLLAGDVVAATAVDDERQAVRMLYAAGAIDDAELERLELLIEADGDLFEALLPLGDPLDRVLAERFRQNLCDYLSSVSAPRFLDQKAVFVTNIQVGHDTRRLVDELCALCDAAKLVDVDQLVIRGRADPGSDPLRRRVAELVDDEPRTIASVLDLLPVEAISGRVLIGQLVRANILAEPGAPAAPSAPAPAPAPASAVSSDLVDATPMAALAIGTEPESEPSDEAPFADDEDTMSAELTRPLDRAAYSELIEYEADPPTRAPPVRRLSRLEPAPRADDDDEDVDDDRTEQIDRRVYSSAVAAGGGSIPLGASEPRSAAPQAAPQAPHAAPPPATPPSAPATSAHAPSVPGSSAAATSSGAPRSLADWLNRTEAVGEDELDFFSDNERGGEKDGMFRTDSHNLDKVEVADSMTDGSEVLEADEAPATRYSAPVLTHGDAVAKIEVANEVLAVVSQGFDDVQGPGRGRAILQLLVDGVPSQFAALLRDLRVGDNGELPTDALLRNLHHRPSTEHRQLLNGTLVDVIERALSAAADELPDEAVDEVLEATAGYRQRLGL